jgi:predicted phosphate transport protein (TIGR00153 family)
MISVKIICLKFFNFLKKREEDALAKIVKYSFLVLKTVEKFRDLVTALLEGKDEANSIYVEVDVLETQADEIHRKLTEELAKGTYFSHLREDFLALLEKIDDIADSAKDASKILMDTGLKLSSIKLLVCDDECIGFVDRLYKATSALVNCLQGLRSKSARDLLKLILSVERYEEEADDVKARLMRELYAKSNKLDVLELLAFKDFLNMADNIADGAEDASDIILRMVSKGYT